MAIFRYFTKDPCGILKIQENFYRQQKKNSPFLIISSPFSGQKQVPAPKKSADRLDVRALS